MTYKELNTENLCVICHTDCKLTKCTKSNDAAFCTECSDTTKYLNSGSCVLASACPGGKHFIFI